MILLIYFGSAICWVFTIDSFRFFLKIQNLPMNETHKIIAILSSILSFSACLELLIIGEFTR